MISLLLTRVQGEAKDNVNNKHIIQMYLGYNLLISQRTIPINASSVPGITSNGLQNFHDSAKLLITHVEKFNYKNFHS